VSGPSAEVLLVAALVALYLQDSARLLHFDEVLVEGGGRRWSVSAGHSLELRGRFLSLPHPLLPMRTRFRASWLDDARIDAPDTPDTLARYARMLWPIRVGSSLVGVVLLGVVPWLLLGSRDPLQLLAALACTWLLVAGMTAWLMLHRARLQVPARRIGMLTMESLLCPPHAINLYRRLCAMRGFHGDPVAFASTVLPERERARLRHAIDSRLDLFAVADHVCPARVARLAGARARVAELLR